MTYEEWDNLSNAEKNEIVIQDVEEARMEAERTIIETTTNIILTRHGKTDKAKSELQKLIGQIVRESGLSKFANDCWTRYTGS